MTITPNDYFGLLILAIVVIGTGFWWHAAFSDNLKISDNAKKT
jgi:hypothetical protein